MSDLREEIAYKIWLNLDEELGSTNQFAYKEADHIIKLCESLHRDIITNECVEIVKSIRIKMAKKDEEYNQGYANACNDIYQTLNKVKDNE